MSITEKISHVLFAFGALINRQSSSSILQCHPIPKIKWMADWDHSSYEIFLPFFWFFELMEKKLVVAKDLLDWVNCWLNGWQYLVDSLTFKYFCSSLSWFLERSSGSDFQSYLKSFAFVESWRHFFQKKLPSSTAASMPN